VGLDDRHGQDGQSVAQSIAIVSLGTGIDHHGIYFIGMSLMDLLAHGAFVVGLIVLHLDAQFLAESLGGVVDVRSVAVP